MVFLRRQNFLCATGQLVRLQSGSSLSVDRAFLRVWALWVTRTWIFSFLKNLVIFLSNPSEINGILKYSQSLLECCCRG